MTMPHDAMENEKSLSLFPSALNGEFGLPASGLSRVCWRKGTVTIYWPAPIATPAVLATPGTIEHPWEIHQPANKW